ncbi:MAG: hypothetical protein WC284_07105 [Candidimonas sp.]|jgi:cytochrome c oxidase subunit 2
MKERSQQFSCRSHAVRRAHLMLAACQALAGCAPAPLSILEPVGPQAEHVARVWYAMAAGSALILLLMVLLAVWASLRPAARSSRGSRAALLWGGGVIFPLSVLIALLVYGHYPDGKAGGAAHGPPFRVQVHAHQWWWEVRYPDAGPVASGKDAPYDVNELHIPVNRPIHVELTSEDVIHSFWAPRLGGKMDAIPGRVNRLELMASEPGVYLGVCAEFCGAQHAHMAFRVVAHDGPAWLARQRPEDGGDPARVAERDRP